jgi:hypothetical protein
MEADLSGEMVAAMEVTCEVEGASCVVRCSPAPSAEAGAHGSSNCCQIGLARGARVKAIRPAELLAICRDLESRGRWRALDVGDCRDPFVGRLQHLGVESVCGFRAKPGRGGAVRIAPGVYGGRGWAPSTIDSWLRSLLASDQGLNKINKLARAGNAAERHLVVVLDPFSQAGMGISLALADRHEDGSADEAIPSLVPPESLTHVWLMPVMGTGEALCWSRRYGWAVANLTIPD